MRIAHALDFLHASNATQFESPHSSRAHHNAARRRGCRDPASSPYAHGASGLGHYRHGHLPPCPHDPARQSARFLLPGDRPFVAPSAFLQARQKLGDKSIERLFHETASLWHQQANHPSWAGLQLLAVDGLMWRTPDTPDNAATFAKPGTRHGETVYPQVRMLCQMELTSHLLVQTVMGTQEVAAPSGHSGSELADSLHQRQGVASADLNGRPDAFPGRRHR